MVQGICSSLVLERSRRDHRGVGRKIANDKRQEEGKKRKRIFQHVIRSDLQEPTVPRKRLKVDGIQSTHGLTYLKSTGMVYDHVYPDVTNYSDGLEVTEVTQEPYQSKDKHGVVQDTFLLPPYAPLPKLEYNPGCCKRKATKRDQKMKAIADQIRFRRALKLRQQPLRRLG